MGQSRFAEPAPEMVTPRPNRIDLHTHTTRSDGVLEPAALYAEMGRWGLRLAAIADHDTLAAYRELSRAGVGGAAGPNGLQLISALEINSVADEELVRLGVQLEEGELHMLGYGVDPDDDAFEQRLLSQRDARRTRLLLMIEALRRLGKPIDEQIAPYLASEEALGRPHVARAMVAAGYVESVQEAFDLWIDRDGPAYVPRQGMRTREAVEAIVDAGGLAVLAHYPAAPEQAELISLLMDWGLRGLEVHYRRFLPETVIAVGQLAERLQLLVTGGSDYHGDGMSYAEAQATTYVPDAVGDRLLAALARTGAGAGR